MRKLLQKTLSLFISICLAVTCSLPAFAVNYENIDYENISQQEIFIGLSKESDSQTAIDQIFEATDFEAISIDIEAEIPKLDNMPEFSSLNDVREYVQNEILMISDEELDADRSIEKAVFNISNTIYKNDTRTDRYIVKYKMGRENNFKTSLTSSVNLLETSEVSSEKRILGLFGESKTETIVLDEKMSLSRFASEIKETGADRYIEYIQPDYKLSVSDVSEESFGLSVADESLSEAPVINEGVDDGISQERLKNTDNENAGEQEVNEQVASQPESEQPEANDVSEIVTEGSEIEIENPAASEETDTPLENEPDLEEIPEEEILEIQENDNIIVALIDTGVDTTHELISPYISVLSYDFVNDSASVYNESLGLEQSHGTHIAGTIAMAADEYNAGVEIMALKVFEDGTAYTSDIIAAIKYAQENGADIVNCSFGSTDENPALLEVIENSGLFVVCAAGNERSDLGVNPVYPAAFDLDNIICVGSVNADDGFSYFSNYSTSLVDIAAQGRDVESTLVGGGLGNMSGTSMAAAQVSAAAAILLASEESLNTDALKARIIGSSDKLDNLLNKTADGSRLNLDNGLLGESGEELSPVYEDDFDVHGYNPTPSELYELYTQAGDVVDIDMEIDHALILKEDGTVWAVGVNKYGECGIGATSMVTELTQVVGLTNVTQIAVGEWFSLALKSDGTVWSWGYNEFGQLGIGNYVNKTVPQQVNNLISILQIDAGYYHALALKSNGKVYAWGDNSRQQVGSSQEMNSSPIITGGISGVSQISVGGSVNMLLKGGNVWTWGECGYGQLGTGLTEDSYSADMVPDISNIEKISMGETFALALQSNGTVWSWGRNNHGQLGNNSALDEDYPVQVSGLTSVTDISAGYSHAAAVKSNGTIWTWGYNDKGALGDGTYNDAFSPVQLSAINDAVNITCLDDVTFAKTTDGKLWGWGSNTAIINGMFDGKPFIRTVPEKNILSSDFTKIAQGASFSIGLKSDGTVWSWGLNGSGQLGDGTYNERVLPVQVSGLTGITDIASGSTHVLALKSDGTVYAWGSNNYGQLGDGSLEEQSLPVQVSSLSSVVQVEAGERHSLALKSDGTVYAWGNNKYGQLGNGSTANQSVPVKTNTLTSISYISAGAYHNLAVKSNGGVYAWGLNSDGQLGNGATTNKTSPVLLSSPTLVSKVEAGYAHSLALRTDGTVYAWGDNSLGQGGFGSTLQKKSPYKLSSLSGISQICAGESHSVALKSNGTVYVWGSNGDCNLGDGTYVMKTTPTINNNLSQIEQISSGQFSNFAKNSSGEWLAWGNDYNSQLGFGRISQVNTPTRPYLYDVEFGFTQENYTGYIPASGQNSAIVTAVGYAENGEPISASQINYSLNSSYEGVSIDSSTGVVTIQSTAQAGTVGITAEYGGESVAANLILTAPTQSVSFSFLEQGYSSYIPLTGQAELPVEASGTNEYGNSIEASQITYSLAAPYEGVSINSSTGVVTIQSTAQAGTVGLRATYGTTTVSADLVLTSSTAPPSGDTSLTVSAVSGESVTVRVDASNLESFENASYSIYYDSTKLTPTDLCAFTWAKETDVGLALGSGVTIEAFTPGEITFSVSRSVPEGKKWSGILNAIRFNAVSSGDTTVTLVKNTVNE